MSEAIKTICCECGDLIRDGRTINGYVSHGYCKRCAKILMAIIKSEEKRNETPMEKI